MSKQPKEWLITKQKQEVNPFIWIVDPKDHLDEENKTVRVVDYESFRLVCEALKRIAKTDESDHAPDAYIASEALKKVGQL